MFKAKLPPGTGVGSVYLYSMQTVRAALAAERPDLESLLMERLLPVLVSSRQLLTVEELAWAAGGADVKDVSVKDVSVFGFGVSGI